MKIKQKITSLLSPLSPKKVSIINESHMHAGKNTESHFKLIIVSSAFSERSLLERQRMVQKLLKEVFELVHAISIFCYTPDEEGKVESSPKCRKS